MGINKRDDEPARAQALRSPHSYLSERTCGARRVPGPPRERAVPPEAFRRSSTVQVVDADDLGVQHQFQAEPSQRSFRFTHWHHWSRCDALGWPTGAHRPPPCACAETWSRGRVWPPHSPIRVLGSNPEVEQPSLRLSSGSVMGMKVGECVRTRANPAKYGYIQDHALTRCYC